jgi:hypothetical protein
MDEAVLALEVLSNALLLENHQRIEKRKSNDQNEIEQPVHPAIGPVRIEGVREKIEQLLQPIAMLLPTK